MASRPTARTGRALLAEVDAALQAYAARGVFRGFSAADGARGVRIYRFAWIARRPMVVTLSPARRVLTFVRLFPAVAATPGVAPALKQAIASASTRALPAHRRIDPKRARMSGRVSGGDLTLQLTLEAGRASSTVRAALAVVNDLFLLMRECYPDYLTAQFGLPDE